MRRYAKDMAMLSESRRAIEVLIRKEQPDLKPSEVRRMAKELALDAYKNLKAQ